MWWFSANQTEGHHNKHSIILNGSYWMAVKAQCNENPMDAIYLRGRSGDRFPLTSKWPRLFYFFFIFSSPPSKRQTFLMYHIMYWVHFLCNSLCIAIFWDHFFWYWSCVWACFFVGWAVVVIGSILGHIWLFDHSLFHFFLVGRMTKKLIFFFYSIHCAG